MKKLLFLLAILAPLCISAQTIKTDVLILGSNNAAFAAGVQAAESGVQTTVLMQSEGFYLSELRQWPNTSIRKAFEKKAKTSLKLADSVSLPVLSNQMINAIIKSWTDTAKLFNVIPNLPLLDIKRSGNGWELKLSKAKSIKAKVLVLTQYEDKIFSSLKVAGLKPAERFAIKYLNPAYRTSIGGIYGSIDYVSLYSFLIPNQENLIYIAPDYFEMGQAAGATAAYAAFYKTKTSASNLKRIQGELLNYKLPLIPFSDIESSDPNWLALQKVGVTGILKGNADEAKLLFNPEKNVSYDEINQPIKDYYYKAQIWFDDHQNVPLTLEHTISMVCYVGNKAIDATTAEIEKKWKKVYHFSTEFDLKKVLTRREFAVIINEYIKPFDGINVDKTGRVIR